MPLLLFKIQYRNMFLVLHTLPVVAYWIIYSEKANFVLDRKKNTLCARNADIFYPGESKDVGTSKLCIILVIKL